MKNSITPLADQTVTTEQQKQLHRFIADAVNKAAEHAVEGFLKGGLTTRAHVQQILSSGKKIGFAVSELLKDQMQALAKIILRPVSGAEELSLDETDGTETLAEARDVFNYVDGDFKNHGTNVPGVATGNSSVTVLEMAEDATHEQMFGALPATLDDLCLSQAQIKQFVKKYRKWLRTDGYATFFLFKVGDKFFVANVYLLDDGRLGVFCHEFSYAHVWRGEFRHRIVVPLTPATT